MSISIARTAPAACRVRARAMIDIAGPPGVDERAVGGHPDTRTPHEHVVAQRRAEHAGVVLLQRGVQLPVVDDEHEVLAHRLDVGRHGEVAAPHARRSPMPSCLMTNDAAPFAQRHDLLAVEVGAAVGGVHLEAGVERGDRDVALRFAGSASPTGSARRRAARGRRRSWRAATWCRATSGPCSTRCAPRRAARTWCRRQAAPTPGARSAATRPRWAPPRRPGWATRAVGGGRRWIVRVGRRRGVRPSVVVSVTVSCTLIALGLPPVGRRVVRVPPALDGVHDAVAAVVADPLDRAHRERVAARLVAGSRRTRPRPG